MKVKSLLRKHLLVYKIISYVKVKIVNKDSDISLYLNCGSVKRSHSKRVQLQ